MGTIFKFKDADSYQKLSGIISKHSILDQIAFKRRDLRYLSTGFWDSRVKINLSTTKIYTNDFIKSNELNFVINRLL